MPDRDDGERHEGAPRRRAGAAPDGDPADVIDVLIDGFNRMPGELQAPDAALLAHQDTLGAAVAERPAELRALNSEMAAGRDRAMDASRVKSEFLANMSHEIRTPMNGILGMTELALGTEVNPETREYLTTVMTSAESLLAILNDILDFSKIESRKLELEAVSFSPRDLLAKAVKVMGHRAEQEEQPVRPLHILLAEDNVVNQRVATGLLERRGHRVTLAANGREAVEAVGRETFDLVLMDVQMPEMEGIEATRVIREREAGTGRHVRIVAMTAHAMSGDRERCLAAGMDGYLSKPINQAELFRTVEQGQPAAAQPAAPVWRVPEPAEAPAPAPSPAASDRTLDVGELLARVGGDPALMLTVVRLFLQDCPARLSAIHQAVLDRNPERLRTTAHALRGAAGTLSARGLMGAAETLERLGAESRMDAAEAAWKALTVEAALLAATLQALDAQGACAP